MNTLNDGVCDNIYTIICLHHLLMQWMIIAMKLITFFLGGYISSSEITVQNSLRVEVGHGSGYLQGDGGRLFISLFTAVQHLQQ